MTKTQREKAAKRKRVFFSVLTIVVIVGILVTAGYFGESRFIDSSYEDIHRHTELHQMAVSNTETWFANV